MNRKEKGYSLIELVVTLAIFSILMVALIVIMRTSMVTYRDGLFETQMQEEVQITANQVSEFLIDAYSFEGQSGDSYSFTGPDGAFTLTYSPTDHTLYYNTSIISDMIYDIPVLDEDGNVVSVTKGFEITGLSKRASKDDKVFKDNEATIKINATSDGRTYSATKDVYFRNNVEDSIAYVDVSDPDAISIYQTFAAENADVENSISTGGVHDVALLRFDELDLSREFGIVYGIDESQYSGKGFIMTNPDATDKQVGHGINNQITASFKASHSDKTYEHYVMKVDPTLEALNSFKEKRDKILITGFDANDEKVEVYVHLDAVSIEVGSKILHTYIDQTCAADGYPNDITVKGINIDNAMKPTTEGGAGMTVTYDATFKKGSAPKGSYSKVSVLRTSGTGGSPTAEGASISELTNGWGFGIFANTLADNMVLVIPNGLGGGHGENKDLLFDGGQEADTYDKNNLKITFYFNDTRVPGINDELEYEVYAAGKYLTNAGK